MIAREAVEADLEGMRVLNNHLQPADPVLPASELQAVWRRMLGNESMHCFVIELDGQLAATCTLVVVPNLTRSARPYGFIENVVTHRDYRRRGLGTAVLQAALDLAWSQGCYKVMLMTGSREAGTHAFYAEAGFQAGEKTAYVARPG